MRASGGDGRLFPETTGLAQRPVLSGRTGGAEIEEMELLLSGSGGQTEAVSVLMEMKRKRFGRAVKSFEF
ncbi:MAG: hypothetical protein ACLRMZ_22390 [Blautia marasmi]